MAISARLVRLVKQRAQFRCEYCRMPEQFSSIAFEVDHIIATQHGGKTMAGNLALACFGDNHHKGPNLAGIDPKTGKKTWLYNPRRQKWERHFLWRGPILVGKTAVGRATIATLNINAPHRIAQRGALMDEGVF